MQALGWFNLAANNGKYVLAEPNLPLHDLRATEPNEHGNWERFEWFSLGGSQVALRARNGKWVCAEEGGGGRVTASRDAVGPWETFDLVDLGDEHFALRAPIKNKYLCAEGGGGKEVLANRDAIGPWETFRRRKTGVFNALCHVEFVATGHEQGALHFGLDYGRGYEVWFDGTCDGIGAFVGGGAAIMQYPPERLVELGEVTFETQSFIAYAKVILDPGGVLECAGLNLPGGGVGRGNFHL